MIPPEEMRGVTDLKGLNDDMLAKLGAIGEVVTRSEGEYLFREGDPASTYYIVKEGEVILEFRQEDGSVRTETVGPGMSVGCSAIAGLKEYTSDARCKTPCKLLSWSQSELRHLFNQEDGLGYQMMRACAMSLNKRIAGEVETKQE